MLADETVGFEALFRAEYRSVVRTLVPILGDVAEAEAVTQEAFLKAMTGWDRVHRLERPGAWVRRVAIRDAVRSARRTPIPVGAVRSPSTEGLRDAAGRVDLHQAIGRLPVRQRAAVTLHHLAGWPVAEVAAALGCAEVTVRVHLHRARRALEAQLSTEAPEVRDGS